MFKQSVGEILEIVGTIAAITFFLFLGVWAMLEGLNVDLTNIFNNIDYPEGVTP